jgi:nitrogen fixation NifU-like protein
MSDLSDLYQEVILDHNKRPRNFHRLPGANRTAEGFNPLCGDHITVDLTIDADTIHEVGFTGSGCAVSKASASMMTEALKGKSEAEADALFQRFHALVTGQPDPGTAPLGKLSVFSGVSEFPMRVKCATLAWHTLRAALEGKHEPVSTE